MKIRKLRKIKQRQIKYNLLKNKFRKYLEEVKNMYKKTLKEIMIKSIKEIIDERNKKT